MTFQFWGLADKFSSGIFPCAEVNLQGKMGFILNKYNVNAPSFQNCVEIELRNLKD